MATPGPSDPCRPRLPRRPPRSSPPRKKILVVAEFGILNGGERSQLAVLPSLIERGWDMTVLLPPDSEFASALDAIPVSTLGWSKHDRDGKRLDQPALRQSLENHFRDFAPDLIHCNSLSTGRLCGPVSQRMKIPAVGHLRDIIKLSRRAVQDINQLDSVIAVSNATRHWHIQGGMNADLLQVVYNGVDLDTFRPLPPRDNATSTIPCPIRHELKIPNGDRILLFVGQIGVRKGVDLLLAAFDLIGTVHQDTHLLIVGERNSQKDEAIEFERQLHRHQSQSPAGNRIHWLGRRTDVAELMRRATLLIHPARQEPLGRTLLESAASGLPIVTTDVGGSSEILLGLEEFDLLQPTESLPIANRVLELLSTPEECLTLSQRLRTIAENRFPIERCAASIDRVYRQTLSKATT